MARTVKVEVRATPEEKARLKRLADDAGLSVSDFVRNRALEVGGPVEGQVNAAPSKPLFARTEPDVPDLRTARGVLPEALRGLKG